MCGGTIQRPGWRSQSSGLSPRVRGNLVLRTRKESPTRSIPACAGEPVTIKLDMDPDTVYPRVCGGTGCFRFNAKHTEGLSPRVRGNRGGAMVYSPGIRSIPACAGEPPSGRSSEPLPAVYPRVCGGTYTTLRRDFFLSGLSPRVRGNPTVLSSDLIGKRSIPACAGEPQRRQAGAWKLMVYPRVCGGTTEWIWTGSLMAGLSPRVRGNPYCMRLPGFLVRSIPACAGEPSMLPFCHWM